MKYISIYGDIIMTTKLSISRYCSYCSSNICNIELFKFYDNS